MLIPRTLASTLRKCKKSLLLLGPRQTGKSTLIKTLAPELTINLSREDTFLAFSRNPGELLDLLRARRYRTVFVDEVQRLPSLLNTIQAVLDDWPRAPRFYLTGSSARKLRRGQANLLPGRIHTYQLAPLSPGECGYQLDDRRALETGTLPGIYTERNRAEREKTLRSYAATYLREESQADALTRNLEGFSRFLFVAAVYSGRFMDYTKLASESQISRQSATRYFEILEDTLVVRRCPAHAKTAKRRLIQHPRYYFFDTGVLNALLENFRASSDRKGLLFENLFFNMVWAQAAAEDRDLRVSSYRTEHGAEVDLIVERAGMTWAIELKASTNVGRRDLRGLKSFVDFHGSAVRAVVAYQGSAEKKIDGVSILPWQEAIRRLFMER